MIRFLALKSFRNRKFVTILCILSISLSLTLFLMVEKLRHGIELGFTNSISNADLIVGARSSPLQLLLYTVFHLGSPTNNITMESYQRIKSHRAVDWTIPISLGDSYEGFRVVATDENFYKHYQFHVDKKLSMREGEWKAGVFNVTLGAKVAYDLKHKLGDSIVLSHGLSEDTVFKHENTPFKVTGILNTTGTPVDKSVFISLLGMEAIHVGWETGVPNFDEIDEASLNEDKLKVTQITSFILRTRSRIALLGLQRGISTYQQEPLTALIPAMTLTELWGILDQLEKALLAISFFVIIVGFLTVIIALFMSLDQRQREIAILRSIGASALQIAALLLVEAILVTLTGAILGFAMQYGLLYLLSPILEVKYSVLIPITKPSYNEMMVVAAFVGLGSVFGLIPTIKAYLISLNRSLSS